MEGESTPTVTTYLSYSSSFLSQLTNGPKVRSHNPVPAFLRLFAENNCLSAQARSDFARFAETQPTRRPQGDRVAVCNGVA
jgi:hypothetical protein